ncbi:MAG: acylphosphatase [Actinomycetota bacterium]|nr:acylphosphatase [Actinomycetota bacterium]
MSTMRRRVHYSGGVQGVGFRYTSRRLAQDYAVGGYVRNLPDGRVELVAEGDQAEVEAFLEAIRQRLGDHIRDIQVVVEPPDHPPLSEFTIRF